MCSGLRRSERNQEVPHSNLMVRDVLTEDVKDDSYEVAVCIQSCFVWVIIK